VQGKSLDQTLKDALLPVPNPHNDDGIRQLNHIRCGREAGQAGCWEGRQADRQAGGWEGRQAGSWPTILRANRQRVLAGRNRARAKRERRR
jgi:hypothetical protein